MSNKWQRRDKKRRKARYGMRVTGRSIITVQQALAEKRRKQQAEEEALANAGAAGTAESQKGAHTREHPSTFPVYA